MNATVENRVRHYRKKRGLTQAQLAVAVGVKDSYISQIEGGGKTPSLTVARGIAKALGVRVDTVFPA